MKLRVEIDSIPYSVNLESIQIQKQLAGRSSTASFSINVSSSTGAQYDGTALYDVNLYDDNGFSFDSLPQQQSEVIIYDDVVGDSTDTKVFRGFVTSVARQQKNRTFQIWTIGCNGIELLLGTKIVNRTWTGSTDRLIIQDAFGDLLPEISTLDATVAELAVALDYTAKDQTLRDLLESLSKISGAEYRVTEDKELSYRAAGSVDAAFGFASDPDDSHSPPLKKWILTGRERHSENFANSVELLGTDPLGVELTSTATNSGSISDIGLRATVIPARDIDNQPALDLAASIALEQAGVSESITFDFFDDGLDVGQLVQIDSPPAGVSSSYVINVLSLKQTAPDKTRYTAQVGDPQFSLAERLRQLDRIKNGPKALPVVTPPSGSIDSSMLADGAVTRLKLAAQAVSDAQVDVAGLSRIADLAITNTKIADNAISTPKLQAGSVDTTALAALSVVAGKIAAGSITGVKIQAGSITAADAVFAAAAIGTADIGNAAITGAKIASATITAANIASATITDAQIANATISAAKIASIDATTITTGTLNVGVISAGSITGTHLANGTISAVKISSVDAGTITTGTLSVGSGGITVSGNISGALLDNGTVSDVKIASGLSASKITTGSLDCSLLSAGTITAAISINSGGSFQCTDGAYFYSDVSISGETFCGDNLVMSGHDIQSAYNIGCVTMSAGSYKDSSGNTVIDSLGVFVGAPGINTAGGVGCAGVNPNGHFGQTHSASPFEALDFNGGVLVSYSGYSAPSGPGSPSFASFADVQSWCGSLLSALTSTGLIT